MHQIKISRGGAFSGSKGKRFIIGKSPEVFYCNGVPSVFAGKVVKSDPFEAGLGPSEPQDRDRSIGRFQRLQGTSRFIP